MDVQQEQLIRDYKNTFTGPAAERVLENLNLFCRAKTQQSLFDYNSERQTAYNLGAHSVFRYIQSQINAEIEHKKDDCTITEPKDDERDAQ